MKKQKRTQSKLVANTLFISAGLLLLAATSVYGATGDTASGAFANNGDSGNASQGTYNAATSGDGILSATTEGKLTVTTDHVSVTNSGTGQARGIFASGPGSMITLHNATVRTAAGTWNAYNDALCAMNGGQIIAEDLDLATAGSHSAGIRASGTGSSVTAHDIVFTGTGNPTMGLWAEAGGQIDVGQVDITIKSSGGVYGYGIVADGAGSTVTATGGKVVVNDLGSGSQSNSAIRAINGGTVTVTGPLTVSTNGNLNFQNPSSTAGGRGVYASDGGTVNLKDITIETKGPISNGFEVGKTVTAPGAGSGAIHVDGNIDVAVTGMNSIALALQAPTSAGGYSEFTTTETSTTKLRSSSGPVIAYQGGINSIATLYNVDIATTSASGSNAAISVGRNYTVTSLQDVLNPPPAKTTDAVLNLYNGTVKAGTAGSLVDVTNGSSFTLNADNVTMTGITTRDATSSLEINLSNRAIWQLARKGTAASGMVSTFNALNLNSGSILDASGNTFTINGNVNNTAGVVNLVKSNNTGTTITINGVLTQGSDGALNVALGPSLPLVTATSADLAGDLNVIFSASSLPTKSSQIPLPQYTATVVHTTGGITGDFDQVNVIGYTGTALDYLVMKGGITADNMDYILGLKLAWTDGGYEQGTGNFTIPSGATFEVDTVLADQTVPDSFASGWDGKSLVKKGEGLLILSAENTYSGGTTVNDGRLSLVGIGDIGSSTSVTITGGVFDISELTGTGTTIQNLSSGITAGNIVLAGKNLTINQTNNLTYAGDFDDSTGGITKEGAGTLTLSGQTLWTGITFINAGTLTLDGVGGGAQLVSDVVGQAGAVLNINNGASLTGTIDPLDVNLNGGLWNVTGDSDVLAINSNNGHVNFMPPPADSTNPSDYKIITATGLNGQNGSLITMNTNLAANVGDRIVTDATSGNHTIWINNTGGDITGTPQVLEIITVTNQTQSLGDFTLGNPNGVVDVGNYKFHLVTGDKIQQDAWSWYLAVIGTSNQTQIIISAADQAGTWLMQNDSLLRRMGELRTTDYSKAEHGIQSWVRGYGWQSRVSTNNNGADYKSTVYGVDAGTDKTWQTANGRFSTGIFVGFSADSRDVGDNAGDNDINTIYGGLYGTWMTFGGFYIDAVAKTGSLNTDVKVNGTPRSQGSYSNWGILGSVEIGQQFKNTDGWFIEPQLQGAYVHFTSAGYRMNGTAVDQNASGSFDARAGLVAGKTMATAKGGILQPYIRAMAGQTWTDGGEVKINGDSFDSNSAGSRYEVGGGLIWQINGHNQLYTDYTYINGERIEVPWRMNLGYRIVW